MRKTVLLLGISAAMLTSCSSSEDAGLPGSGHVRSEVRNVSGIQEVSLDGVGDLTITQTGSESLMVEAEDNFLPFLKSEQHGNRLVINLIGAGTFGVSPTKPIRYTLTVKDLRLVDVAGHGTINIQGLDTPTFQAHITGLGNLQISGRTDSQEVQVAERGRYQATAFASTNARVDVSASGGAVIQVKDTLNVQVSEAGTVEYSGNPVVQQKISGTGSVKER